MVEPAAGTKSKKLPHIGRRIIKSAVGAGLCLVVYMLRGRQGIVFYSMIALLQCMQQDIGGSIKMAVSRMTGTMLGAAFGLIAVLLRYVWLPGVFENPVPYYILVTLMIIPVLYTSVVLHRENVAYFSAVVFLCISVSHIEDTNILMFVFNRVLDTFIGIAISIPVNMFRIPRRKRRDILFVCDADTALLNAQEKLSPYTRFELRRMLQDGAQFTISTMRTPASVMDVLGDIKWPLPAIVMDGAALYSIQERRYVETVSLPRERVQKLRFFFEERGMNCFANTLIDGVLLICYTELKDEAEKQLIHDLNKSPYRNFVRTDLTEEGRVLYIMAVDETERIRQTAEDLRLLYCYDELKICVYESEQYPGNSYIKIYDHGATREHMTARLLELSGLSETVIIATSDAPEKRYGTRNADSTDDADESRGMGNASTDHGTGVSKGIFSRTRPDLAAPNVIVNQYDGDRAVKILEKLYEPYFWKK